MSTVPGQVIGAGAGAGLGSLRVVRTRDELADARSSMPGSVAVVMTMGALHAGHTSLIRAARAGADHVIVTIFVNPLQFGPAEDFDRYPRTFDADLAVCVGEGVDLVFAPQSDQVYPAGAPTVRVDPGPLGSVLEGASRPGHFAGVLTVVAKLLQLNRPDRAYFGEKDYQQLTLIRAMVRDLDLPVQIVGVPTVREADGLARSSRNRYLTEAQRADAVAVIEALRAGQRCAERGGDRDAVLAAARARLADTASVVPDYVELTDGWLAPAPAAGPARLLAAVVVGTTRLIDNVEVQLR